MRDNIIKKRVRADEVVTKVSATNRELNKLQMTNNNNHSSNNNSSGNADLNSIDNSEWQDNDLSGDYHNSAGTNTCPSCFKKFERKAVYTTHISTCFYLKNKDKFKVQKKIAGGTKTKDNMQADKMLKSLKTSLESEENSNASGGSFPSAIKDEIVEQLASPAIVVPVIVPEVNKRKRKRTNKIKKDEAQKSKQSDEGPTDDVDWDLDDEEEKKKLNNIKKEINDDEYTKATALITDQSANTSSMLSESSGFLIKMDVSNEQEEDDDLFDDDDDSGLIIDEKAEDESIAIPTPDTSIASTTAVTSTTADASTTATSLPSTTPPKEKKNKDSKQLKCNLCEKTYKDEEKLKYHMSFYHKRQKRFKCTLCEYQGYRRKDTMNHLNYVHNIDGTKETLEAYMESVIRSVDDESLQKQSILKKKQIQMKKQKQREKVKLEAAALKGTSDKNVSGSSISMPPELKTFKPDFKLKILPIVEPPSMTLLVPESVLKTPTEKPPKASRKSRHSSVMLPPETKLNDDELKVPKFVLVQPNRDLLSTVSHSEGDESSRESSTLSHRRLSVGRVCKDSSRLLSTYGKIMKSPTSAAAASGSNSHGHKDASTRRPIRNRIKPVNKDFVYDLSDLLRKDNDAYREGSHLRLAGLTRRRGFSTNSRDILDDSLFPEDIAELMRQQEEGTLSSSPLASGASSPLKNEDGIQYMKDKLMRPAFNPPSRPVQLNPSASPSTSTAPEPTRGPAYKIALEAFNKNSASLFEPQFLTTISFNQMPKTPALPTLLPTLLPIATSTPSAASSILQKYFNAAKVNVITPIPIETLTTPNTSSIFDRKSKSMDEFDNGNALSPEQLCQKFELFNVTSISENELDIQDPSLKDDNSIDSDAIKKECNDGDEDVAKLEPIGSAGVTTKVIRKKATNKKSTTKACRPFIRGKRGSDKRKYGGNGQRRLTVMQRLQENKIRKSREQLFKRMLQNRRTNSTVYNFNLFNEA